MQPQGWSSHLSSGHRQHSPLDEGKEHETSEECQHNCSWLSSVIFSISSHKYQDFQIKFELYAHQTFA